MAVGITTTDGKDLDDRYIRTISGNGPDANGNVTVNVPVTSVQGATGAVMLALVSGGPDINVSQTINNGSTYTYTVTTDGIANVSATANPGKTKECQSHGDEDPTCWYEHHGSARLQVKLNGATLFDKTVSSGDSRSVSWSISNQTVKKGDVFSIYAYRSYNHSYAEHSFSFRMSPMLIIAY